MSLWPAAARVGNAVKLDFETQQQTDAFLKAPFHYANQFDIAPGVYNFRMILSSGATGFGSIDLPLNISPWNGQTLSVSGLALSRTAQAATDSPAGLGASLVDGPHPLAANGVEVLPMGSTQFHKGERGMFYFEAYEPQLDPARTEQQGMAPVFTIRIRVLDRTTGQQKSDSGLTNAASYLHPGNPVIPIALVLPTAELPAGDYKLELSVAHDKGQDAVMRTADFEIR